MSALYGRTARLWRRTLFLEGRFNASNRHAIKDVEPHWETIYAHYLYFSIHQLDINRLILFLNVQLGMFLIHFSQIRATQILIAVKTKIYLAYN